MLRFLPPGVLDSGDEIIGSLHPWQQITLMVLFACTFIFLFLAAFIVALRKRTSRKVDSFFFTAALVSFFSLISAFFSFPYANSSGWLIGLLIFVGFLIALVVSVTMGMLFLAYILENFGNERH